MELKEAGKINFVYAVGIYGKSDAFCKGRIDSLRGDLKKTNRAKLEKIYHRASGDKKYTVVFGGGRGFEVDDFCPSLVNGKLTYTSDLAVGVCRVCHKLGRKFNSALNTRGFLQYLISQRQHFYH